MSVRMEENINRWTAKRKTALLIEMIQDKTTVTRAGWSAGILPSEIEGPVEDLRADPGQAQQRVEAKLKFRHRDGAEIRLPKPQKGPMVACHLLEKNTAMSAKDGTFVLSEIDPDGAQTLGVCAGHPKLHESGGFALIASRTLNGFLP